MTLTAQNLLHFLLERGVLEPAAAVDGDVRIAEITRRHRNFKLLRRNGTGLFIKQVKSWDAHTISALQREGTCCWLAANDGGFAPLRAHLPPLRDYDTARNALVVELFAEAEGLMEYHQRRAEFPPEIGQELGRLLGELHTGVHIEPGDPRFATVFPGMLPPILTLHQTPSPALDTYGPAAAHVIGLIRADAAFARALADLVRGWQKTALIHGDVKWDNCLLVGTSGHPDLKLVDWELADVGDPGWDAGAVFQAYLAFWVWSMPPAPAAADTLVAQARFPLEQMQPAMQAFWKSYAETRGIPASDNRRQLLLCLRYAAGRMLQTAFEMAVGSRQLTSQTLLLVQLSQNLLTRTHEAVHELLGM